MEGYQKWINSQLCTSLKPQCYTINIEENEFQTYAHVHLRRMQILREVYNLYMHILFSISEFVPLFFPPPKVRSLSPL